MKIFEGDMPDVTPAQVIAVLLGGVPVIATLLNSFGIYDLSAEQQDALTKTLQWAGVLAVGLFGADAGLRAARNSADAKVKAAMVPASSPPPPAAPVAAVPLAPNDDLLGAHRDLSSELPSDEDEFGGVGFDEDDLTNGHHEYEPVLPSDEEEFAELDPDDDVGPDSRLQPVGVEEEELL